jgi:hypothetical protein
MRLSVSRLAAVLVAACLPGLAHAGVYKDGHCQVTVPDGWVASKTRIASPDKSRSASLLEAPTSAEIVKLEASLGAKPVSENGAVVLMTQTASYGGKTNRMYHAISKSSPSCLADAGARAVAMTVKVAK